MTTFDFNCVVVRRKWKSPLFGCTDWSPETAKKWSVSRWACKNKSRTNSPCNLPDVLGITGINDTTLGVLLLWSGRCFRIFSEAPSLSDWSELLGYFKCPLRLGSVLLPTLSWAIRRSNTNAPGPPHRIVTLPHRLIFFFVPASFCTSESALAGIPFGTFDWQFLKRPELAPVGY